MLGVRQVGGHGEGRLGKRNTECEFPDGRLQAFRTGAVVNCSILSGTCAVSLAVLARSLTFGARICVLVLALRACLPPACSTYAFPFVDGLCAANVLPLPPRSSELRRGIRCVPPCPGWPGSAGVGRHADEPVVLLNSEY